jgi:hypothetical protein
MSYYPISCESTDGDDPPLQSSRWQPLQVMIIEHSFYPLIFKEVEAPSPKDRMIDFVIQVPMREL